MTAAAPVRFRRRGRYHSGPAHRELLSSAVDLAVTDISRWPKARCVRELALARWGSTSVMPCPHCSTNDAHYWRARELRWKCRACDKTFSVTSGTVFANRRAPLQKLIAGLLLFVNCPSGQPALELRRHLKVSYGTAFTWQHKLREGLMRGFNVGVLSGDIEVDGNHRSGFRAAQKRGRPQGSNAKDAADEQRKLEEQKAKTIAAIAQANAAGTAKVRQKASGKTGAVDPEFGQRLDKHRRILIAVTQRSGARGFGSSATRVAVARNEDVAVAQAVARAFIAVPESALNTDTSPAYTDLGTQFREHRTVEHSRTLVGPAGENNNQVESIAWRIKRGEKGIYLNIEPKYWSDYAVEFAWRSDVRRLSNGGKLRSLLGHVLGVGPSLFWRGFTHGHHRKTEILVLGEEPAPSSGPPKGVYPIDANLGRKPR